MSDLVAIVDLLGKAWDETDLSQSQFARVLRREADLYEEAPELARDPNRSVDSSWMEPEPPSLPADEPMKLTNTVSGDTYVVRSLTATELESDESVALTPHDVATDVWELVDDTDLVDE